MPAGRIVPAPSRIAELIAPNGTSPANSPTRSAPSRGSALYRK